MTLPYCRFEASIRRLVRISDRIGDSWTLERDHVRANHQRKEKFRFLLKSRTQNDAISRKKSCNAQLATNLQK